MVSSPTASSSRAGDDNQKHLDREIRDMVSTLAYKLSQLQSSAKQGSTEGVQNSTDDEQGIRFITLAGNNTGATMRADLSDILEGRSTKPDDDGILGAYANGNYQAVNNSIMISGSYSAEDPGIHIVISDNIDEHDHQMVGHHGKHEDKKKKKKSTREEGSDVSGEKTSKDGEE